MHAIATGPPTRVKKERFPLLIAIQYGIEVSASQHNNRNISMPSYTDIRRKRKHAPVGKKRPATQEDMWPMPSETFEAFQQRSVDPPCAKLVDELVVIDGQLLPVARDGALYVPRRHDLLVRRRGIRRLDRGSGGGVPAAMVYRVWPGAGDGKTTTTIVRILHLPEGKGIRQLFRKFIGTRYFFRCHFCHELKNEATRRRENGLFSMNVSQTDSESGRNARSRDHLIRVPYLIISLRHHVFILKTSLDLMQHSFPWLGTTSFAGNVY
jgi:hypothetical protein